MKIKRIKSKNKIKISKHELFTILMRQNQPDYSEDAIDKYFDDDFFRELIDDLCDNDINIWLDNYLSDLAKWFSSIKDDTQLQRQSEEAITALYNCKPISYNEPIKYDYFKKVAFKTIPLTKLVLLVAELSIYAQTIKEAYRVPLKIYAQFDVKKFIMHTLTLQISDILDYGTKEELIDSFKDIPEYYRMFGKARSSMSDYWCWIFIYDVLKNNCRLPLKNIAMLSKMYAWESFKACENKPCIYKEDDENRKLAKSMKKVNENKTAYNAYTKDELLIIYNAKTTYETVVKMYKFTKFISKTLHENLNYKSALNNLQKLTLDTEMAMFEFGLNQMYQCAHNCTNCEYRKSSKCLNMNLETTYQTLKEFANHHLTLVYNTLFKDSKNISDIVKNLEGTQKQEYAIEIIRDIYPFFTEKSNKTISNIFSMNTINNEQEYFEQYKESYYEKQDNQMDKNVINVLNTIADSLELYLKNPSEDKKVFTMMNIKQLQMIYKI